MSSLVMRRFTARLTALSERTAGTEKFALGAGKMLTEVLGFEHVLEAAEREPDPDRYRQHVLYVDPAGWFSVVTLVWLPGHGTLVNGVGEVSVLTAGPDIHRVTCDSAERTISIHVYGADITKRGTSINLTYAPDLVLADTPG
jgi:YD repeat-containing protein